MLNNITIADDILTTGFSLSHFLVNEFIRQAVQYSMDISINAHLHITRNFRVCGKYELFHEGEFCGFNLRLSVLKDGYTIESNGGGWRTETYARRVVTMGDISIAETNSVASYRLTPLYSECLSLLLADMTILSIAYPEEDYIHSSPLFDVLVKSLKSDPDHILEEFKMNALLHEMSIREFTAEELPILPKEEISKFASGKHCLLAQLH